MKFSYLATAALLSISTTGSIAASVTLTGTNFDVTYDSAAMGLFGSSVTLTGNQLSFFPTSFVAQSGSGIDVTNSTIALKVSARRASAWPKAVTTSTSATPQRRCPLACRSAVSCV